MNMFKTLMAASVLSMMAFGSSAATLTATSDTLDSAEAIIAAKAKAAGADSYTITSARMGNVVTMSAETK
ncbi:YdgH/BhsA/McbA-like domain containing protein [Providencia rettgeri]|uniref:YdgH/BhsA/McbA-like domain containing protein n=1 Tax=Providencia rettgeri TaxID=587 RepID=UPI0023607686|nr:YdgH/BhsA/McbA-like domain containing protein [Providencia rettgeri]